MDRTEEIIMKLPNGYGSVYKVKDTRRKPYVARKTIRYDQESGRQVRKIIGYYASKKEALAALSEFNVAPFDLDKSKVDIDTIYNKAISHADYSENTLQTYRYAYKKYFEQIKDMPYSKLTIDIAQNIIDNTVLGNQGNVRNIFKMLEKYALEFNYTSKQFCGFLKIHKKDAPTNRKVYTYDEIRELWKNEGDLGADLILIYLYTGFRLDELLKLKKENVHLAQVDIPYLQGGSKTKAGKNRIVPIHHKILPIITRMMQNNGDYLVPNIRNASLIRKPLSAIYKKLNLNHCVHDCRHTFRSELDRKDANRVAVDRLIGHANTSVGERVYTHKSIKELYDAIELITFGM